MASTISQPNLSGHNASLRGGARRFGDRLARLQFRPGTFYTGSKPAVPLLALVIAWCAVMRNVGSTARLLDASVSVRHLLMGLVLFLLWNGICGLKKTQAARYTPFESEIITVLFATGLSGAALSVMQSVRLSAYPGMQPEVLIGSLLGVYGFLLGGASILSSHLIPLVSQPRVALMVGTGPLARSLSTYARSGHQYQLIGCIDDEYLGSDMSGDQYLGSISKLETLLKERPIESVLIALPIRSMYNTIQRVVGVCEAVGVEFTYTTDFFDTNTVQERQSRSAYHRPLAVLRRQHPDYRHLVKRGMDIVFASLLLLVLAPALLAIALAVRLTSPGPVLFV